MPCLRLRRFIGFTLAGLLIVSMGYRTLAQEALKGGASFKSEADDLLTVERVSVLPFTDNLQGIYSRPLEAHAITTLEGMHRWDFVPATGSGPILSPEELESSTDKVLQATQGLNVDAVFSGRITKGPNGVTMHMSLFLTKDGKLLAQAILKDFKQFNLPDLKEQTQRMISELVARIPYAGRVLSRDNNRVTVNLGARDGLRPNQMLSVIQIIQTNRHPKFNFLISSEKEIIGKIKILKVEETLSFGTVVTERERGAVQKNAKIGNLEFVSYSGGGEASLSPSAEEALTEREDGAMVFGKDARAWQPQNPPSFGQVGARIGISQVNESAQVSGVGGLESSTLFAPSVTLDGELWITPEWTFRARIRQGIMPMDNPRNGSTPGTLNQSVSYYEAGVGYRIRFGPNAFSPYAEPQLGYLNYKLFTDSGTPEAYVSQQYTGFKFGVSGAAPMSEGLYGVGGEFAMVWKPSLKESPVTSGGSSDNQVVQFGVFGYKRLGERLKLQAHLDFEMYSSNFTGVGTRAESSSSTSHRYTTLSGGLYYLF